MGLAVVMNRQEAEQITGQADPSPINEPYNWKRLGRGRDCQDGWPWSGGDDRLRRVRDPSLSYVHTSGKIGSVDVFSATFAALWGWADKKLTECLRREFLTDYVAWPLPFTLGKVQPDLFRDQQALQLLQSRHPPGVMFSLRPPGFGKTR